MKSKLVASTKAGLDAGLGLDDGDTGGDDYTEHQGSKATQTDILSKKVQGIIQQNL